MCKKEKEKRRGKRGTEGKELEVINGRKLDFQHVPDQASSWISSYTIQSESKEAQGNKDGVMLSHSPSESDMQ